MYNIPVNFSHLIIIGNGFDLNLGLKTSYKDFMKSPFFTDSIVQNTLCKRLSEKAGLQNWIDIENELKPISNSYPDNFENDFYYLSAKLKLYLRELDYSTLNKNSAAYKLMVEIDKNDFLILDFNYTKSTELILQEIGVDENSIKQRHIKIHGSVEQDDIIFGVEDSAQINKTHIFIKKSFSKIFKGIQFRQQFDKIVQVTVFGHSLGETDHMYFSSFFGTYSHESYFDKGKKLKIYHYGHESYKDLHIQLDALTQRNLSGLKQNNDFEMIDCSD